MQESFRLHKRTVMPAKCNGKEWHCEIKHVQCKSWSMATSDPGLDVWFRLWLRLRFHFWLRLRFHFWL